MIRLDSNSRYHECSASLPLRVYGSRVCTIAAVFPSPLSHSDLSFAKLTMKKRKKKEEEEEEEEEA